MIDDPTLQRLAADLVGVRGVRAVVLGGSRATGSHLPTSDYDLGVYYDEPELDVHALGRLAERVSGREVEVASPGRWGAWVDGGAWLSINGSAVDWILRNRRRVEEECGRAVRGEFGFHAQPGHPLGFLDVSYAGEVAVGRPLADPDGVISRLKAGLDPYPQPLRRAFAANLWQAGFLLDGASKGALRRDVAFVALSCATAAMICAHAWHAAAGVWVLNEKDLVPAVGRLPLETGPFLSHAQDSLCSLGLDVHSLERAINQMRTAVAYTVQRLG